MIEQETFTQIYRKHKSRIHYYLHTLQIPYQLRDEFYAEGMYAMWTAYKQYDQSKGKLSTFLNYRIRFRMIDLIRKIEREKHVEEKVIKEQTTKLHSGNKNRSKNQFLITSSQLKIKDNAIWHYVKNRLTVRQWKWVYYFIVLDKSLKEIAEIENVTIEAVKGWAKETRNKLRKDPTFKTKLLKTIYKQ